MPSFSSNIRELKGYTNSAPQTNRDKIKDVISLYEKKKIVNFKTALNTVMLLASKNKNTIKSGRADKEYNKVMNKYDLALPMTGRLERQRQEKQRSTQRTVKKQNYFVKGFVRTITEYHNTRKGDTTKYNKQYVDDHQFIELLKQHL